MPLTGRYLRIGVEQQKEEKRAERWRDSQCGGKRTYSSYAEALQTIRRFREQDGVKPYRCPHCGLYHFGHSKPEPRRREKSSKAGKHKKRELFDADY